MLNTCRKTNIVVIEIVLCFVNGKVFNVLKVYTVIEIIKMDFTPGSMEKLVELLRPPEPEVLQGDDLNSIGIVCYYLLHSFTFYVSSFIGS